MIYKVAARPKDMKGWSGAEIKTWCKLARKKMDVGKKPNDADELIVPVSRTMATEIEHLRTWKEGKTIPASRQPIVNPLKKDVSRKVEI